MKLRSCCVTIGLKVVLLGAGVLAQGTPGQVATDLAPTRVHISPGVTAGLLIKRVNPEYPKKARKQHITGVVIMQAEITTSGDIADLTVVSGDPLLAESAVKAVKQWKYKPYLLEGKRVQVETTVQVNFTLSR